MLGVKLDLLFNNIQHKFKCSHIVVVFNGILNQFQSKSFPIKGFCYFNGLFYILILYYASRKYRPNDHKNINVEFSTAESKIKIKMSV